MCRAATYDTKNNAKCLLLKKWFNMLFCRRNRQKQTKTKKIRQKTRNNRPSPASQHQFQSPKTNPPAPRTSWAWRRVPSTCARAAWSTRSVSPCPSARVQARPRLRLPPHALPPRIRLPERSPRPSPPSPPVPPQPPWPLLLPSRTRPRQAAHGQASSAGYQHDLIAGAKRGRSRLHLRKKKYEKKNYVVLVVDAGK